MSTSGQGHSDPLTDSRLALNWVVFLITVYATSVEVFLRKRMGRRFLGWQAVAVIPVVMVHASFCQPRRPDGLILFLGLYLIMCVCQRIGMLITAWRGRVVHSRYNGFPLCLPENGRWDEVQFKRWGDPLVVAFIGFVVTSELDRPLGMYLLGAALALHLQGWLIQFYESTQRLDLRDAAIEQQLRGTQFQQDARALREAWHQDRLH